MPEKNKAKQRMGAANGRFKGWKSSDYRRRITWAKKGDLVHHIDGDKTNNAKSNFKKLKPKDWMTAIWVHNSEAHPEKAVKWWKANKK